MSERVGEACDAWRDDTPPWKGRGRRAWLAGWLAGWSGMMMVVGETKRVDVEYTEVARPHRGYTEGGRERERVQRTGANFRLALSGFTRSAFRTEGKKRRSELADRAVAKLKDLLKNPTDYWSQFGE